MASSMLNQGIPIVGPLLNKIIGTRNDRFVKKYTTRVAAISALEEETRRLTDDQLRGKLEEFRSRADKGESASELLVEAFAIAREAMDRSVGLRNIFNPKHNFDASALPSAAREMYEHVKAQLEGVEAGVPLTALKNWQDPEAVRRARDDFADLAGSAEPVPAWQFVDIPPALYEAVRALYPESRPPFRARPFDVQLIGAMVLFQGKIAEMKTGEGKTIVAPLAAYLAAIDRLKVHVVTVNDYLVQRDRDWTFPYFRALGLTVGAIHPSHQQPEAIKREMYRCDVVYGTTSEFGFDYLRDNMKRSAEQQVQRVREFAIVDEVDSILIDEARTPLIISGEAHDDAPRYDISDRLARHLVEAQKPWQAADDKVQRCILDIKGVEGDIRSARDKDKIPALQQRMRELKSQLPGLEAERDKYVQYYELQLDRKQAHLTHDGIAEAQRSAGVGSFYVGENMDLPHLLVQAIRAHTVYQLDRDYVVMDVEDRFTGKAEPTIVIVDVNTGRPMIGRQWSDGLHQAIEAKEGVPIKQETQTVATITIQNFFKMYKRLAGMTGTADTEAQEFHDIYRLDVVSIPTNKAVTRRDFDDLMFLTGKDKWSSIVDEIKEFSDVGRPVLVGTTSVERSETLSQMLTRKHGVKHEVLNAKPEKIAREAEVVEQAGQLGSVMIATNMAGRGTDIKLGRATREQLLDHWLRRGLAPRTVTVESTDDELREAIYRKIAPGYLGIPKREAEEKPFAELEIELLRHWARTRTWETDKRIASMNADELRDALDRTGRFLMHRVRWFENVEDIGGLHVIGTERHESRRVDNQLRGRGGRQGDRGSSRFYVSLEDDLMKLFAGETQAKLLSRIGLKEGDAIEHPWLSKAVERAQRKVEERNFQGRKTLLEYDEVMEHQRQRFYGVRQRVLEGRDVRGLLFDYITESVDDAIGEYLSPDYAPRCASEFAKQVLDCDVPPERLRGKDLNEMIDRIRADAKQDARSEISVTTGEYLPTTGSEVEVDFDAGGLSRWAKTRFGVDLDPDTLREQATTDRRAIEDRLHEAACERIDAADLAGIARYVEKDFGAQELAGWADKKFGIKITVEEIMESSKDGTEGVRELIVAKTEELYRQREVEYPVDFAMDVTMANMRADPRRAAGQLVAWANERFGLGWTIEGLMTMPPQRTREELRAASEKYVREGRLDAAIAEAIGQPDFDSLKKHMLGKYKIELPPEARRPVGEERENMIRARIESVLRAELLYFERTLLLDTLDPIWKDHLYSMEKLRDGIGLRAFSQQDPRIAYKREGAMLFAEMMVSVRDRVTDYLFKVKLSPMAAMGGAGGMPGPSGAAVRPPIGQPGPSSRGLYAPPGGAGAGAGTSPPIVAAPTNGASAAAARPAAAITGGMITGPGIDDISRVASAAPARGAQQRDIDVAQRAGTDPSAKPQPVVKSGKQVGRNDPCPCGSGQKYKKCCGRGGAGSGGATEEEDRD